MKIILETERLILREMTDDDFLALKKVISDPETLARDINYLSNFYDATYAQPVDMFPMTAHV